MAVSFARYFAKCGKKTLYFNTEELGDSSIYFMGEGQFSFDDLIYAVKSKKANMTLKFESTVNCSIIWFTVACSYLGAPPNSLISSTPTLLLIF